MFDVHLHVAGHRAVDRKPECESAYSQHQTSARRDWQLPNQEVLCHCQPPIVNTGIFFIRSCVADSVGEPPTFQLPSEIITNSAQVLMLLHRRCEYGVEIGTLFRIGQAKKKTAQSQR